MNTDTIDAGLVFAEIGRLHLQVINLEQKLRDANAKITALSQSKENECPKE